MIRFFNDKKKFAKLMALIACVVAIFSVAIFQAATIDNNQNIVGGELTNDPLKAEHGTKILTTLGIDDLGKKTWLPIDPAENWGWQSTSGASVGDHTGGEGGIGVNSDQSGTLVIFGRVQLSKELVDLRQSGALKIHIESRFGTSPIRDSGSVGIGKAGLSDDKISNVPDLTNAFSQERLDFSPGKGIGWSWDNRVLQDVVLDSTGVDVEDEMMYVLLMVESSGGYGFTFSNVSVTLEFSGSTSVYLKKSAVEMLGGKPVLTADCVTSGKNTETPTGKVYANSTALTFQTENDYFSVRAASLPGFLFLGWQQKTTDTTPSLYADYATRTVLEARAAVGGIFATDEIIRLSLYERSGYFQLKKGTFVTAVYVPLVYEIEFDKGEGTSGTMTKQYLPFGANVSLSENKFLKTDNSFTNWLSDDGRTFADRQFVFSLQSVTVAKPGYLLVDALALKFTAQWSNYSIGGSDSSDAGLFSAVNVFPNGEYFSIKYQVSRKSGDTDKYTLVGVYAKYSSHKNPDFIGKIIALDFRDGYWFLPYATGIYTLSTEWVPKAYSITYAYAGWTANAAEMQSAPKTYYAGMGPAADKLPVNLTAAGKTFAGWTLDGAPVKGNDLTSLKANITLSASELKDMDGNSRAAGKTVSSADTTTDGSLDRESGIAADYWQYRNSSTNGWGPSFGHNGDTSGYVPTIGDRLHREYYNTHNTMTQFTVGARFVSLSGEALKAFLMGETVRVSFDTNIVVGAKNTMGGAADARGWIGLAQGYVWANAINESSALTNQSAEVFVASRRDNWGKSDVRRSVAIDLQPAGQPGFSLQIRTKLWNKSAALWQNTWTYSQFYITSYTVTFGGKTERYTVSFDGNGGVKTDLSTAIVEEITTAAIPGQSATVKAPENLYERTGYRFIGWSDDKNATGATVRIQPGGNITTTKNTRFYAVWEKKKYTVVIFDSMEGDADSPKFEVVRKTLLREYGADFDFLAEYRKIQNQTPSYTEGFAKFAEEVPPIIFADNTMTTDENAARIRWLLNAAIATNADDPTVEYGTVVDLAKLITFVNVGTAETVVTRWDYATGGTGEAKFTLGTGNVGNVDEGAYEGKRYFYTAKTTVNVMGTTVFRTKKYEDVGSVSAMIKPIVVGATVSDAPIYYNGELQRFPISFKIKEEDYPDPDKLQAAKEVFTAEFEGKNSYFGQQNRGVRLGAPTLTFLSRLGGSFAPDEGFKHVGEYDIRSVMLVETSGLPNRNYIWDVQHTDDKQTLTGVDISAKILPVELSFVFFFTQKVYNGSGGADPEKMVMKEFPSAGTYPDDGKAAWYLYTEGFVGRDFENNKDLIREYALKRTPGQDVIATGTEFNPIYGGYDVYLDEAELTLALKNNYDFLYFKKDRETDDFIALTERNVDGNIFVKDYFVITHKTATIEWSPIVGDDGYTYSGKALGVKATVFGIVEGELISFVNGQDEGGGSVGYNNNTFDILRYDAGTYIVNVSISGVTTGGESSGGGNYILQDAETTFTILQRVISVKFSDEASFTYDNTPQGITLTLGNIIEKDALSVFITTSAGVGAYAPQNAVVTGGAPQFTVTMPGVEGSTNKTSLSVQWKATARGTYSVNHISIDGNLNYKFADTLSKEWQINQKELKFNWSGAASFIYSADGQGVTLLVGGIVGADNIVLTATLEGTFFTVDITTAAVSNDIPYRFFGKNAGTYRVEIVSITGAEAQNYKLDTIARTASFSIVKKEVRVTRYTDHESAQYLLGAPVSFVYDKTAKSIFVQLAGGAASGTDGFVYNQDLAAVRLDYSDGTPNTQIHVGTYQMRARFATDSVSQNYVFDGTTNVLQWTVLPRAVQAVWSGSSADFITNGNHFEVVYDGEGKRVFAAISNAIGGDSFTLSYQTDATSVDANQGGSVYENHLTGVGNPNYRLPVAGEADYDALTKEWRILPRVISAQWNPSQENLQFVYNAEEQSVTLTLSNVAIAAPLTFRVRYAGGMSFDVIGADVLGSTEGERTVLSSDDILSLAFSAKARGAYGVTSVEIVSANAANYVFLGAAKQWIIGEREVQLDFDSKDARFTYRATEQGLVLTVTGLYNKADGGKDDVVVSYSVTLSRPELELKSDFAPGTAVDNRNYYFRGVNAGTYRIVFLPTLGGADGANYKLVGALSAEFIIVAKEIAVVWHSGEFSADSVAYSSGMFTYDKTEKKVSAGYEILDNATPSDIDGKVYQSDLNKISFTYSGNPNVSVNAGNYTTAATSAVAFPSANYVVTSSALRWAVEKRAVTVSFGAAESATYDGAWHGVSVVFGNVMAGDSVLPEGIGNIAVYDVQSKMFRAVAAGSYNIKISSVKNASYPANDNYRMDTTAGVEVLGVFTIQKRPISILWGAADFTYDGSDKKVTQTVVNTVGSDAVTLSVTGDSAKDYGDYTARVTAIVGGAGSENYTTDGAMALEFNWGIKKKSLVFVFGATDTFFYRKKEQGIALTLSGLVDGEDLTVNYNATAGSSLSFASGTALNNGAYRFKAVDAGDYMVVISAANLGNGTVGLEKNYVLSAVTGSFSIRPKEIKIVWKTTDDADYTMPFSYNGQTVGVRAHPENNSGVPGDEAQYSAYAGDTVSFSYAGNADAKNVGTYTTNAVSANQNYTVAQGYQQKEWEITARTLSVAWGANGAAYGYDGIAHGVTLTVGNIVVGDTVAFAVTGVNFNPENLIRTTGTSHEFLKGFAAENSGAYSVSVVLFNQTNYTMANTSATWTIEKRLLTIGFSPSDFQYDRTEKSVTARATNAVGADDITFTYQTEGETNISGVTHLFRNKATQKGDYVLRVTGLEKNPNGNYALPENTALLEKVWQITARLIYVSWQSESATVYDGLAHGATITLENIAHGDNVQFLANLKRGGAFIESNFTLNAAVSSENDTDIYTYQFNKYQVGAETKSILNVGAYLAEIVGLGGADSVNYAYRLSDSTSAEFSIVQRELVFGFSSLADTVYDGAQHGITATVSNLVGNEQITLTAMVDRGVLTDSNGNVTDGQPFFVTNDTRFGFVATNAGTYLARVTKVADTNGVLNDVGGNYKLPLAASKEFLIKQREVSAVWQGADSFVYSGGQHFVTATGGNTVLGEVVEFQYDTSFTLDGGRALASAAINRGLYLAKIVGFVKNPNSNYCLSTTGLTKEWQISALTVQLEWSEPRSFLYDGEEKTLTAVVKNRVSGDGVSVSYKILKGSDWLDGNSATDAGAYSVKANALSLNELGNYQLPTDDVVLIKTLEITKRAISYSFSEKELIYNRKSQGIEATFANIVESDLVNGAVSLKVRLDNGGTGAETLFKPNKSSTVYQFYAINAGNYTACVIGVENNNYTVAASQYAFVIARASITVVMTGGGEYVYNANNQGLNAAISGIYLGDEVGLMATASGLNIDGSLSSGGREAFAVGFSAQYVKDGEYIVSIDGTDNPNYTLAGQVIGNFSITKKKINLAWAPSTTFEYDGTAKTVTAGASFGGTTIDDGKVYDADGELAFQYSGNTEIRSGKYWASVQFLNTGRSVNYVVGENATFKYQITQRQLTVTFAPYPSAGGYSSLYDGKLHGVTVKLEGIVDAGVNVKSVLTGDFAAVGFQDTASVTDGSYAFSTKNKGNYSLKIATVFDVEGESGEGCDYVLYFPSGEDTISFQIGAKEVSVLFTKTAFVYSGVAQSVVAELVGLVSGDTVRFSYLEGEFSDGVMYQSFAQNAGQYNARVSADLLGESAENYVLTGALTKSWEIAQKQLTFTLNEFYETEADRVSSFRYTYNKQEQGVKLTLNGLIGADTVTVVTDKLVEFSFGGAAGLVGFVTAIDANAYTVKLATLKVADGNYKLSAVTASFSIEKRKLQLEWGTLDGLSENPQSVGYDGGRHGKKLVTSNVLLGDDVVVGCNPSEGTTREEQADGIWFYAVHAGSYSVMVSATLTGASAQNYVTTAVSGSWQITRKIAQVTWGAHQGLVYNGAMQSILSTVSNAILDDVVHVTLGGTRSAVNADEYTVAAVSLSNANYRLPTTGEEGFSNLSLTWVIAQKTVKAALSGETKLSYTGQALVLSNTRKGENILTITFTDIDEDIEITEVVTFNAVYSAGAVPVTVGDYSITVSPLAVGNYTFTAVSVDFNIKKRTVAYTDFEFLATETAGGITTSKDYDLGASRTFVASGVTLGFSVKNVKDTVFAADVLKREVSATVKNYFGYASCAVTATSLDQMAEHVHAGHLHIDQNGNFPTIGAAHAGVYWATIALSGALSANYELVGFSNYDNAAQFEKVSNGSGGYETYLKYPAMTGGERVTESPLPNDTAMMFLVSKKTTGGEIVGEPTVASAQYNGGYHHPVPSILPTGEVYVRYDGVTAPLSVYLGGGIRTAGVYEITFASAVDPDVGIEGCDEITVGDSAFLTLTVEKRDVALGTVDVGTREREYDGTVLYDGFQMPSKVSVGDALSGVATTGLIEGDDIALRAEFDKKDITATKIIFELTGFVAKNYLLNTSSLGADDVSTADVVAVKGSILKRILKFGWKAENEFVYNATEKPYSADILNAVMGDDVSVLYAETGVSETGEDYASSARNAGRYRAMVVGISGAEGANYALPTSVAGKDWSITAAELLLSWTDYQKTDDDLNLSVVYSGALFGKTLVLSPLQNGDTVQFAIQIGTGFEDLPFAIMTGIGAEIVGGSYPFTARHAGTYSIFISGLSGTNQNNYVLTPVSRTFTIVAKEIEVDFLSGGRLDSAGETTYNAVPVQLDAKPKDGALVGADIAEFTLSGASYATNAADYILFVESRNPDYKVSNNQFEWKILQKSLAVSFDKYVSVGSDNGIINGRWNYRYSGSPQGVTVNVNGLIEGEAVRFNLETNATALGDVGKSFVSVAKNANVGEDYYYIRIIGVSTESKNYNLASQDGYSAEWQISAVQVNVSWGVSSFEYNGLEQSYRATLFGVHLADDVSIIYDEGSVLEAKDVHADGYLAKIKSLGGTDGTNYSLIGEVLETRWFITAKAISFVWANIGTADTDRNLVVVYDGNTYGKKLTVGGILTVDSVLDDVRFTLRTSEGITASLASLGLVQNTDYSFSARGANPSGYSIVILDVSNKNYSLPQADLSRTFIIKKRVLALSAPTETLFEYNKTTHTAMPTLQNKVEGDDVSAVYASGATGGKTYASSAMDAGTYVTQVSSLAGVASANYELPTLADFNWQITPLAAQIELNTTSFVYNKQQKTVTARVLNALFNDVVTVTLTGNIGLNANHYTALATALSNKNYTLPTTVSFDWEITKAELTEISFVDKTMVYNATTQAIAVSSMVTRYGDQVAVRYGISANGALSDGNSATNVLFDGEGRVSAYIVTAVVTAQNYTTATLTAAFTITRTPITGISAPKVVADYSGSAVALYIYYNNVPTTDLSLIKTQYGHGVAISATVGGLEALSAISAGTYAVRVSGTANDNYEELVINSSLEIKKATMFAQTGSFSYQNDTTIYSGATRFFNLSIGDASLSDAKITQYSVKPSDASAHIDIVTANYFIAQSGIYDTAFAGAKNAGVYNLRVVLENPNYTMQSFDAVLTIGQKRLSDVDIVYSYVGGKVTYQKGVNRIIGVGKTADSPVFTAETSVALLLNDRASVVYTYFNPISGNYEELPTGGFSSAGIYTIRALITDGSNNYIADDGTNGYTPTANLIIEAADISGISLAGTGAFDYDGTVKCVVANKLTTQYGEAIAVRYAVSPEDSSLSVADWLVGKNGARSVGNYTITAVFNASSDIGYDKNYKEMSLVGELRIKKVAMLNPLSAEGKFYFEGGGIVYDSFTYFVNVVTSPTAQSIGTAGKVVSYTVSPTKSGVTDSATAEYEYYLVGGTSYLQFNGAKESNVYHIRATLKSENYLDLVLETELDITKFNASIIWDGGSEFVYNGYERATSVTARVQLLINDRSTADIAQDGWRTLKTIFVINGVQTALKNAGIYTATVTDLNRNYELANQSKEISILKADMPLYFVDRATTYDKTVHYIGVSRANSASGRNETAVALFATDSATIRYQVGGTAFQGAMYQGVYEITAIATAGDNYHDYTAVARLTVNTAEITGVTLTGGNYTYTGREYSAVLSSILSQFDETLEVDYFVNATTADKLSAVDAGSYIVKVVLSGKGAYQTSYAPLTLQTTLTIAKAVMKNPHSANFFFKDAQVDYRAGLWHLVASNVDEGASADVAAISVAVIPKSNSALGGYDTAMVEYYLVTGGASAAFNGARNAGVYNIYAVLKHKNYEDQVLPNKTLTILQKALNAEIIKAADYIYNGYDRSADVTARYTLLSGDVTPENGGFGTLSVKFEQNGRESFFFNAGEYALNVQANDSNYNVSILSTERTIVMKKADVKKYYASAVFIYNGEKRGIYLSDGATAYETVYKNPVTLFVSDTAVVAYLFSSDGGATYQTLSPDTAPKNVGNYLLTATIAESENYNAYLGSATLSVSQKELTVTSSTLWSKTYDGTVEVLFSVNESGIVEGDRGAISVFGAYETKNVGSNKTVTFKVMQEEGATTVPSGNYFIRPISVGKITARKLVSTKTDWSKVYDGTASAGEVTTFATLENAVVAGDDLTVMANYNSKNVLSAISVAFTLSGKDRSNYVMDTVFTGVLISKRAAPVTWANYNLVYNGLDRQASATLQLVGADVAAYPNPYALEVSYDGARYRDVKEYALTGAIRHTEILDNYSILEGELAKIAVINKASVTATWTNLADNYVYRGTDYGTQISANFTALGDDGGADKSIPLTISYNGQMVMRDAGGYDIVATANITRYAFAENYDIIGNTKNRTIEKATIDNIVFSGSFVERYETGTEYSFFAIPKLGASGATYGATFAALSYPYDSEAMQVVYGGGEESPLEVSGNNRVKNAGNYVIRGQVRENNSVLISKNYLPWDGSVAVEIQIGEIVDKMFFIGRKTPYQGQMLAIYVSNHNQIVSSYQEVLYPDGSPVFVSYKFTIDEAGFNFGGVWEDFDPRSSARDTGIYYLKATVLPTRNYVGLTLTATLEITRITVGVQWMFRNDFLASDTKITYDNKEDQRKYLSAYANGAGTDGVIRLEYSLTAKATSTFLFDQTKTKNDYELNNGVPGEFRLAGEYTATANYSAAEDALKRFSKNYNLMGTVVKPFITPHTVSIAWYKNNRADEPTDADLYKTDEIYDGSLKRVVAKSFGYGYKIPLLYSNTTAATDAGTYLATASGIDPETSIATNWDGGAIGAGALFAMNYKLPENGTALSWSVLKRKLDLRLTTSEVVKVYNGDNRFPVLSTSHTVSSSGAFGAAMVEVLLTTGGKLTFTLANIVLSDVLTEALEGSPAAELQAFLASPMSFLNSDKPNVNAKVCYIGFKGFFNKNYYLYTNSGEMESPVTEVTALITPKPLNVALLENEKSAYDGKGRVMVYDKTSNVKGAAESKFFASVKDSTNSEAMLFASAEHYNYFVGKIAVVGRNVAGQYLGDGTLSDAGKHNLKILGLNDGGTQGTQEGIIDTLDNEGVHNYFLTLSGDGNGYEITPRELSASYSNTLQSIRDKNFKDIGLTFVTDGKDGKLTLAEFTALLKADGIYTASGALQASASTVENGWRATADTLSTYASYEGAYLDATLSADFTEKRNANNYRLSQPVLQIVYNAIQDAEKYHFTVDDLRGFVNLKTDIEGLNAVRAYNGQGEIPSYLQTADIDGAINFETTVFPAILEFGGTYDGAGFTLKNIIFTASGTDSVGMFATLTGTVKNLKFMNISVEGLTASFVGAVAGKVLGGTIENVVVQGFLYGSAKNLHIGSVVGYALDSKIENCRAVTFLYADGKASAVFVGGLVGMLENSEGKTSTVSSTGTFVEINVTGVATAAEARTGLMSGGSGATPDVYLSGSVSVNGAIINDPNANGKTYTDLLNWQFGAVSGEVKPLVERYVMKRYYFGATEGNGRSDNPIKLSVYTQLAIPSIYRFASFKLVRDIRIPYGVDFEPYLTTFYGEVFAADYISADNSSGRYSVQDPMLASDDIMLFASFRKQDNIIRVTKGGQHV